jgi:hypothetical protein
MTPYSMDIATTTRKAEQEEEKQQRSISFIINDPG